MAGFGDLPIGDASMFASAPASTPQPQQPTSGGGGGLFGFLYHNLVAPTVNAVGAIPGDIVHTGEALGTMGGSILSGHHGAQLAADKQKALDQIRQTTGGKGLPSTVAASNAQPLGQQLEKIAGNVGTQALDVAAPFAGGEELAGKAGFAALKTGAGIGAKLGALGGATNAMSQGQNAEQVVGSAGTGGLLGGATGAAGAGVGRALTKAAGKLTPGATNTAPSFLDKMATKQAQTGYAQKVNSEFLGGKDAMVAGNGTNINSVLAGMNNHRIEPTVANMAKFGNAGFAYNDVLNNSIVPKGIPVPLDLNKIVKGSFSDQPGLGMVGARGSQATAIAQGLRNTLSNSLDPQGQNISGIYHPADLLKAAQDLYNAKPATAAEGAVYAKARQGLINAAGKEGGLNQAVGELKLPSVQDAFSQGAEDTSANRDVQHIVQMAGGNHTLAQEIIDNLNGAKSIQDIQKAEIPHVAANEIANKNATAIGQMLPEVPSNTSGSFSSMGSPGSAIYAAHEAIRNPVLGVPIAAARLGGGFVGKQLAKLGTADMNQVGPRINPLAKGEVAPVSSGITPETTSALPPMAGQAPTPITGTRGGIVPPAVSDTMANLPGTVSGAVGNLARGVSNAAGGATSAIRTPGTVMNALTGNAAAQAGSGNMGSSLNAPQGAPTVDTSAIDQAVQQPTAPGQTLDASSIPGGTLEDLQAEVQADPKNAAVYEQIYNDAQKQVAASGPPKLNATQAKNLTNIQNATAALHNYVSSLNGLSSSTRGAGVGHLSALAGKFGIGGPEATTAASIEAAKPELAVQLAQAMNNGQKAPQGLTKEIEGMLPGVGDPPALAAQKIQRLAENLSSYLDIATSASTSDRTSGDTSAVLQALTAGNQ